MIETLITALMLVVAMIHVLPVVGVAGSERLAMLYGIDVTDPNLAILLRHRAMLFGILGAFLIYAAFTPAAQPIAFVMAFVSIASFFFFAFTEDRYSAAIRKVVIADVVAAVCLAGAVVLYLIRGEG